MCPVNASENGDFNLGSESFQVEYFKIDYRSDSGKFKLQSFSSCFVFFGFMFNLM